MKAQLVLAGIGGQGVLFATKLLAQTAVRLGYKVIVAETHGMSQRGGSVASHLKIGEFASPLVRMGTADYLLAFEAKEGYRNLKFLRPASDTRPGGVIYSNAGITDEKVCSLVVYRGIPADQIALNLGAFRAENLILLGFATQDEHFPFRLDDLSATVEQISPEKLKHVNIAALKEGSRFGPDYPRISDGAEYKKNAHQP